MIFYIEGAVMKKVFALICVGIIAFSLAVIGFAHPGGTDGSGGHYNHDTGEYHYHHGYPEHQHEDGICPYEHNDKTPANSVSNTTTNTNQTPAIYYLIGIMVVAICILILIIIFKNNEVQRRSQNLSLCKNEIQKIKQLEIQYIKENNELKKEVESLKTNINILNQELNKAKKEIENREQAIQNIKAAPKGISFATDNMPILGKNNTDKPYGDYTVYYSPNSHIYHTDKYCASYNSIKMHIFRAFSKGRPCGKCANKYSNFTELPTWFTNYKD